MINNKKILILGGCGYIGSRLFLYLKDRYEIVDTLDLELYGNYINPDNKKVSILDKKLEYILPTYDIIINLVATSSVKMSINNPKLAWKLNVNGLKNINHYMNEKQILIYASSSSVYNSDGMLQNEDCNIFNVTNLYDFTKYTADNYMKFYHKCPYFGLRFGTVCGYSINLRNDLMINKMVLDSNKKGYIEISNPNIYRPILGIYDLLESFEKIIENGNEKNYGIYNLASFNHQVIQIGNIVKTLLGSELIIKEDSPTYNFTIDCSKFEKTFRFEFTESIPTIVSSLEFAIKTNKIKNYGERK